MVCEEQWEEQHVVCRANDSDHKIFFYIFKGLLWGKGASGLFFVVLGFMNMCFGTEWGGWPCLEGSCETEGVNWMTT